MSAWCCVVIVFSSISTDASIIKSQQGEEKEFYDRRYWYSQAEQTLQKRLQYSAVEKPIAKNIILVIGDGMSLTTTTAARILKGQRKGLSGEEMDLAWDTFPAVALSKPSGISRDDGKNYKGLTLVPRESVKALAWNATYVDALAASHLRGTTSMSVDYVFLALAMETLDSWGPKTDKLIKTYNIDTQTGESSACATALFCGVKARYETLGLDAGGRFNNCASTINSKVSSLVDWAHDAGKSTGIVTTSRITHATPAALYAHAPSRYWEDDSRISPSVRRDCKDIALQLIENEPGKSINVIMGGGRRHFLSTVTADPEHQNREGRRLDGRNLIGDWVREKTKRRMRAKYIYTREQLTKVDFQNTDYLLGLFEYSHMEFNVERGRKMESDYKGIKNSSKSEEDPTLAEMTRTATSILNKNEKGFFLFIEGGRIDHAHHYNNPYRALDETLEMETALLTALEQVNPTETLVVVTADHGHVMTFGGRGTPRGNPIFGSDIEVSDWDDLQYTTLLYGTGPGHSEPRIVPMKDNFSSHTDAVHAAAVPKLWATHGGEDVAIYASGPMATILFTGVVEQSYIPHAIAYAACLAHQSPRCMNNTKTQIKPNSCSTLQANSTSKVKDTRTDDTKSRSVVVPSSIRSDERPNKSAGQYHAPFLFDIILLACVLSKPYNVIWK